MPKNINENMNETLPESLLNQLISAKHNAKPIPAFSSQGKGLTPEEGYSVQQKWLEKSLNTGDSLIGYKMGLTSKAKQRDVGVFETIHGFLLSSFEINKNGTIERDKHIHPRIEPEIAITLRAPLEGSVTVRDVLRVLEGIFPAIEVVDSRYQDFKFQLGDVIADNTSASRFMVGSTNYLSRIDEVRLFGVSLKKNGEISETGAPAAVLNDPLLSVVELVRNLARHGRRLEAGQLVLTGGITNSLPFERGDRLEAVWPGETLLLNCV